MITIEESIEKIICDKDYTWKIEKINEKQFSVSKNILYLNNIGCDPSEPQNTINSILKHIREKIGLNNLEEECVFKWKQTDTMFRKIILIFKIKI